MSTVSIRARLSRQYLAGLLATLLPCGIAAAQCVAPYDFEDPPYVGSAAGTIIAGTRAACPVAEKGGRHTDRHRPSS